jgi:hypothetical protein
LLNEFKHTRIDGNDNIVDFHSGMGDIIQVPPYKVIEIYIENNVSSFQDQLDLDKIEKWINDRLFYSDDPDKLFFFSIRMNNNKIVVGCGSDDDHFNICCTSYRLLSYCGIQQYYGSIYHIDGTYKITFENFVLVVFGGYFHLKYINRRNLPKYDVPAAFRKEILSDIDDMHYCTTYEQFVYVSNSKVDKWYYNKLNKYADYFVEQWLIPLFDKWQLFRRPAGYAPTNGCEPINKKIKQDYLPDGKRLHIIEAFQMLEKLVFKYLNIQTS